MFVYREGPHSSQNLVWLYQTARRFTLQDRNIVAYMFI